MLHTVVAAMLAAAAVAPWAAPRDVRADGMMQVPAGAFWMGRDGGPADEAPRHRVYVRMFWIDRSKATNAELAAFLEAEGLTSPTGETRFDADDPDARVHRAADAGGVAHWRADPGWERHPAVDVSWFGARDFCAWRERRLPTEAEWEKAARGTDARRYPWGDAAPTPARAVFGRAYGATEPVDTRPDGASPYGVEDLLGNLREWTSTVLAPYPYNRDDGREGFTGQGRVVVRGAGHDDPVDELSVTRRRAYDRRGAGAGHHVVGFRCATSEDLGGLL